MVRSAAGLMDAKKEALGLEIGNRLLHSDFLRPVLLRLLRARINGYLDERLAPISERKIIRQRRAMADAILATIDSSVRKGNLSKKVTRVSSGLWARTLFAPSDGPSAAAGDERPLFLVISPGQACNLRCAGCYAASDSGGARIEWPVLRRIVDEARSLWNIKLMAFSGGEPLLYSSQGRGVLDIVEAHPELLFLMFTNGGKMDDRLAGRLARMGNLTPAFSVEGMRTTTDQRRGPGVFDSVLRAMNSVRQAGVPFGVSVTVTRDNLDEVLSDQFLDLFFDEMGAFYGFYFQYMPMGREPNFELMPSPDQRIAFWRKMWSTVEKRKLFLIDFWNHGPLVKGCISAGRGGGYLHIDWNGRVTPCVFVPYAAANVNDVYARGGTLEDIWHEPFFETIRRWQDSYGYADGALSSHANWLRPCPFRDHYRLFQEWVELHRPLPVDGSAGAGCWAGLCNYGDALKSLSDEIWEREYLGLR